MTNQFGAFVRPGGKTMPVPAGNTLEGKLGLSSIGQVAGDEFQPVPVSLEIRYFSYLEGTLYEGDFPCPSRTFEHCGTPVSGLTASSSAPTTS
jgi:hypothetical protein